MMITLQQLEIFCAADRHLHFTQAAESLVSAQPTITCHVQALEKHLKLRMFEVYMRHVHFTDAGQLLPERATGVIDLVDSAERSIQGYQELSTGALRLGANTVIGTCLMPSLPREFRTRYPGIRVSLRLETT
jgi:DNA-binding transcriptional LysR family regulator